jgi:hypothetical protein
VLLATGEVCFYEGANLDLAKVPKFACPSPASLRAKPGRMRTREVQFGDKRRFVTFTGFMKPEGTVGAAEGAAGSALAIAGAVAGSALQAVGLLSRAKSLFVDNCGYGERARHAREVWYPILDGTTSWHDLDQEAAHGSGSDEPTADTKSQQVQL